MRGRAEPVMDRLFARLEWQGDCLVWTGGTNKYGYGQIGETADGKRRMFNTHRLMYDRTVATVPEEAFVLHHCDNPPCCNPEHLFLGTPLDNMLDKVSKGRARGGGRERWIACTHGHDFTVENTYVRTDGARSCRACHRRRQQEYRRRKAA